MEFDREEFKKDWANGIKVKHMGEKYHMSESKVSRVALRVLKLKSRRRPPDEDKEQKIADYYRTHTIASTAMHFKAAKITVQRAAAKHKVVKLTKPRRRASEVKEQLEQGSSVRVLRSVPEGFKVPNRVSHW